MTRACFGRFAEDERGVEILVARDREQKLELVFTRRAASVKANNLKKCGLILFQWFAVPRIDLLQTSLFAKTAQRKSKQD